MRELSFYIEGLIEKPANFKISQMKQVCASVKQLANAMPDKIELFPEYMRSIDAKISDISRMGISLDENIVMAVVQDELDKEREAFLTEAADAFASVDAKVDAAIQALQESNIAHNNIIRQQNMGDNQIFNEIAQAHQVLMGYSEQITDLCARYDITSTDSDINPELLSPEEILKLYKKYIKYMRNIPKSVNPVKLFREKVTDTTYQGIILGSIFILSLTPIFGIVTIAAFLFIVFQMSEVESRIKHYGIIQGLIFNTNPDDIPHYAIDQSLLLPEVITDDMLDDEPTIGCYIEEYERLAAVYDEEVYNIEEANKLNKFANGKGQIHATTQQKIMEFNKAKQEAELSVNELKLSAERQFQELKDNYKPFERRFSRDGVFDYKFVLGRKDFMEECVDIGNKNVIIRPQGTPEVLGSFIRLLMVNAFTHISSIKLTTYVYDPNNMGRDVLMLYRNDLDKQFKVLQKGLDDLVAQFTKEAQTNMSNMKGQNITDYNKDCAATGRDTVPYKLLIILSQPKEFEEKEELRSLFEYSTSCGILIWMVSKTFTSKNAFTFQVPFQGIKNPIRDQDNRAWCYKVVEDYVEDIKANRPKGLAYTRFMEVYCPEEKEWTGDADDNIDMVPGFQNGDPDLCYGFPLGNGGNVHALGVGTTGAGKSVFLNHMVISLCSMYSPRDLQLWLCDFKGVEFQFYMKGPGRPEVLPHLKACLCTSDGDYATSLFNAVRNISDFRFAQMKNPNTPEMRAALPFDPGHEVNNTDNAKNWNQYWRKLARDTSDDRYLENCYPRVVLLCDEFQVIFQSASDKNLEKIKEDMTQIAKLGRAANVHMFFTSQSMTGTLKGDVLNQFSLRFALRCTPDVSMDILGTNNSADLPQFGFLYVSATGIKKDAQPKFATPFATKGQITEQINHLAVKARERNIPAYELITYEEATKHDISELRTMFEFLDEKGVLKDDNLFIFGPRMSYNPNKVPDNTIIARKPGENMICCYSDYTDYVQFFNIILANAECNKVKPTIIINSQVEDLTYITCAEEKFTSPEKHSKLLRNSIADMVKWLEELNKVKKERNNSNPVWLILLGWDKGRGLGIDPDISLRNKFVNIMQQCGSQNIHIFMLNTSMNGMSMNLMSAMKYTVAGKCTVDDSMMLLGTKQAGLPYDMKTGWLFRKYDGVIQRDKMYVSPVEREIAASEIVVT